MPDVTLIDCVLLPAFSLYGALALIAVARNPNGAR